ncbi:T3SS effector HopA1 family protein [Corynebacterium sp. KPL2850]|uniref:T3SS effector HopA1 family protein n=1 Tax=Corynebacterium sp. KPL2850 TaxID=3158318 RepID=UPI0032EFDD23
MGSFEEIIHTIDSCLSFKSPSLLQTPAFLDSPSGEIIDIEKESASRSLARVIYSKFHAREKEIIPRTGKADIIRVLRDRFHVLQSKDEEVPSKSVDVSINRSPGFVHIFGNQGWKPQSGVIGRYYLTAPDAVRRVEQFTRVVDLLNSEGVSFQAKTSWNPSIARTDDSVFYFCTMKEFEEAYDLFESDSLLNTDAEGLLPHSIFVTPVTRSVGMAVEEESLNERGLSFGLERSSRCADLIIERRRKSNGLVF